MDFPTLIIGAGPVGLTVAQTLKKRGVPLIAVTSRSKAKAKRISKKMHLPAADDYLPLLGKARIVLLAVKDDAIETVAKKIHGSGSLAPGTRIGHFSGVLSSRVLRGPGALVFSLHPLYAFSNSYALKPNTKITMAYEGDPKTFAAARALSSCLGGRLIQINPKTKPLYHAAATLASNFTITLAALSAGLNEKTGIDKKTALAILFPLLQVTLSNLKTRGLPGALTGPIERGDRLTVQKHLEALKNSSADLAELYRLLSLETVPIAMEKGLPQKDANALKRMLRRYA